MTRGIRGATTVSVNEEAEILEATRNVLNEMIKQNNVQASDVSHVFISLTKDLTATFPAKVLREIEGWRYVPVMCMAEIDVPNGLPRCIRIMMVTNTETPQEEIKHIYQNDAVKLRPDLVKGE